MEDQLNLPLPMIADDVDRANAERDAAISMALSLRRRVNQMEGELGRLNTKIETIEKKLKPPRRKRKRT